MMGLLEKVNPQVYQKLLCKGLVGSRCNEWANGYSTTARRK